MTICFTSDDLLNQYWSGGSYNIEKISEMKSKNKIE